MLGQLVFVLLPVVVSATRLCDGDECDARYARIAGGDMTESNTRPFQVALYMRVGTTGALGFCGGSLVHQEWVLTAAHCCFHDEREVDHVQAILGAHSLYDRYENGRRIVNVGEVVVHPEYDHETFANDLALLRLANVIQITETIDIIRLPYLSTVSHNFAGQGATVSGWGIAANGVTFVSPTLREKLMTVLTDPLCSNAYFNLLPPNTICGFATTAGTCKVRQSMRGLSSIDRAVLCPTAQLLQLSNLVEQWGRIGFITIEKQDVTDVCQKFKEGIMTAFSPYSILAFQGDNGGPMTIWNNSTEETILIGVASFVSAGGCNDELPSVFTRTQRYLEWISGVTGIVLD